MSENEIIKMAEHLGLVKSDLEKEIRRKDKGEKTKYCCLRKYSKEQILSALAKMNY